jgi:hypothetical protein
MSDSVFNYTSLPKEEQREALRYMARLAETAERYDDMARLMKELVLLTDGEGKDLTIEERNLLSVAYKNVIGARRASWRNFEADPEDQKVAASFGPMISAFKGKIEQELETICAEVLDLLENYLVKNAERNNANDEAQVFYIKMLGDYYRYRAESAPSSAQFDLKSAQYYEQAFELAEKTLEPTHPTRLGLALNFSVCYYEILKQPQKACDLAKKAFDLAISKLDKLKDDEYKDSTLIMQLLRDNLTLWMSDTGNDDAEIQVEDMEA